MSWPISGECCDSWHLGIDSLAANGRFFGYLLGSLCAGRRSGIYRVNRSWKKGGRKCGQWRVDTAKEKRENGCAAGVSGRSSRRRLTGAREKKNYCVSRTLIVVSILATRFPLPHFRIAALYGAELFYRFFQEVCFLYRIFIKSEWPLSYMKSI